MDVLSKMVYDCSLLFYNSRVLKEFKSDQWRHQDWSDSVSVVRDWEGLSEMLAMGEWGKSSYLSDKTSSPRHSEN